MPNFIISEHKEACKTLNEYMSKKENYYFIHYSCENFHDDLPYKKGNRIIAIGVLNAKTQSVQLFSLKNSATILNVVIDDNTDEETLNKIELNLLKNYFSFLSHNRNLKFIHWRMNNDCYGFKCLERRFKSLGGDDDDLFILDENNTLNLSLLLTQKYGSNYARAINNNKGSMYTLFDINNIKKEGVLSGKEEAEAIYKKNYDKVYFSLIAKLDALYEVVNLSANNKLKTYNSTFKSIYGTGIFGVIQYIHDNAILAFLFSIFGWILGLVVQYILKNWFNINI